jgi:hypothetical protein
VVDAYRDGAIAAPSGYGGHLRLSSFLCSAQNCAFVSLVISVGGNKTGDILERDIQKVKNFFSPKKGTLAPHGVPMVRWRYKDK